MASDDPLRDIGRGVAQLHLKLSRIQDRLDSAAAETGSRATSSGDGELETLLDLVDAVESALERRPLATPVTGWFGRRKATGDDLWRGLAVASADARERLSRSGIEPAPVEGPFDSTLHNAIEVVPSSPGRAAGTLAATHRRGWLRRSGSQNIVLRTAQVSVHGEQR